METKLKTQFDNCGKNQNDGTCRLFVLGLVYKNSKLSGTSSFMEWPQEQQRVPPWKQVSVVCRLVGLADIRFRL